jgi:hypothetical protein
MKQFETRSELSAGAMIATAAPRFDEKRLQNLT